jgi:hypothetical protein
VALLSSAYDSSAYARARCAAGSAHLASAAVDDANDQFAAYFAEKVSGSIRAPDMFVYIPPFNLLEAFVIVSVEWPAFTSSMLTDFLHRRRSSSF